jgi:hypothetical protein
MKTLLSIAAFMFCATIAMAQPKLIRILYQLRNPTNTGWNDSAERLLTYNQQNLPYQQVVNYTSTQITTWQPGQKEVSSYNNASLTTSNNVFWWDSNNNQWETNPVITTTYSYNANGIELIEWLYANTSTTVKDTFIYNTSGVLTERQTATSKTTYTYGTGGELTETLTQNLINNTWTNRLRITHTYNTTTGMLADETEEYFDNNAWVMNFRYTYTYNTDGTLDVILKEHLDGSTWNGFERTQHFYTTTTGTTKISGNTTFTVYPNPSNGVFTVDAGFDEAVTIVVYNMAGKQVLNQTTTGSQTQLNLDGVAKGVYMVQLQTNSGMQTGKLIIE